jgi:clan AA aspartic protease (TIGR02281 family)
MCKTGFWQLMIVALSVLGFGVSAAPMIYKCKDAQGKLLYQKTACTENAKELVAWTPKTDVKPVTQEAPKKHETMVIKQGAGGHYFLEGEVNSHSVTFVVDTGATVVALPRAIANGASLFCNEKVLMSTANGGTGGCSTTITELRLGKGNLVLKNVSAVIMPNLNEPLLGMNVLGQFNIEQKDREMLLSEHEKKAD